MRIQQQQKLAGIIFVCIVISSCTNCNNNKNSIVAADACSCAQLFRKNAAMSTVGNVAFCPPTVMVTKPRRMPTTTTKYFRMSSKSSFVATGTTSSSSLAMVRNIDLPEALILYGRQVLYSNTENNNNDDDDDRATQQQQQRHTLRVGLGPLIQECRDIETAVIILLEPPPTTEVTGSCGVQEQSTLSPRQTLDSLVHIPDTILRSCHVMYHQYPSAHPQDLVHLLDTIQIQPRPFGGSAGFGRKLPDPERNIVPQRCVVLTTDIGATCVARAVGMRVISISTTSDNNGDDPLADAVVHDIADIGGVDDIATPGSFWLNPPHPRDDYGNRIDDPIQWWIDLSSQKNHDAESSSLSAASRTNLELPIVSTEDEDDDDDDAFRAILADLAPLR